MENARDIELPVGIHDGNVVCYRGLCDALSVEVRLWNATLLELEFRGVVFVGDFQALGIADQEGNLQHFAEMEGSELLKNTLDRVRRQGAHESYLCRLRHFRLAVDGDEGSLDVICEALSASWIDESGIRHNVPHD